MRYLSTRGKHYCSTSAEAIKIGIAPDGGLFVPENPELITLEQLQKISSLSFNDQAAFILQHFLSDYTAEEIRSCVDKAYNTHAFDTPEITPLKNISPGLFSLELWHGPTCAFKDMALQILPHLLTGAAEKTQESDEIVILVATSGDTGKAALEGFKNVPGTSIIVFFPDKGISEIQKMQMVTQEGNNVHVIAVEGNFDDTQSGVKAIFADNETNIALNQSGYRFSSANSINWGRLVPQIVYYFTAYTTLLNRKEITPGEKINFTVPTGNFGNILAGYYAQKMGLPVNKLICAANENNVLTEFIRTGMYDRNRKFRKTLSPSMDILISSNLERLLYEATSGNTGKINHWMDELKIKGYYEVDPDTRNFIDNIFWSEYANDQETIKTIKQTYDQYNYLMDTHTAVGKNVYEKYLMGTGDSTKTVLVSTASPFKFNTSVARAIFSETEFSGKSEFELLTLLSQTTGMPIPQGLSDLDKKSVLHTNSIDKENMQQAVKQALKL
ncbi:MAG: threonine synthase [Clostridiales bacterium]|nr:threonine synthase [Clostridiales bacterium]MCF8022069.1 threonine synthase [Clostridiales bacterium]